METTCKIPVHATYTVYKGSSEPVMTAAEYADLPAAAGLPRPTVQNAIVGKGVRPATMGRIAKALGVDPAELLEEV